MEKLHKLVNGIQVDLTEEEILQITSEWEFSSKFTFEQYKLQLTTQVQYLIDNTAKQLWYDSMLDVTQYSLVNNKWKQEADSLLLWNSQVWELVELHFNSITNVPQDFSFIDILPKYLK